MTSQNNLTQAGKVDHLLSQRQGNYTPVVYFKEGGTRHLYRTDWGLEGERQCVVKLDKANLESPRAIRHKQRGCDTLNELTYVTPLDHPGIVRLYDYFSPEETAEADLDGAITVEQYISNAESLEERVSNKGPLTEEQFRQVFMPILDAEQYTIREQGIFHRDLSFPNILVQEIESNLSKDEKVKLRGMITDWANACSVEQTKKSFLPTAGAHLCMDPLIMGPLTGEDLSRYTEQSEIYEIVTDMVYAVRGRPIFEYNPDTTKALAWDTGESVLNSERKVDSAKHNRVLKTALRKLPRDIRKYNEIFYRGLTLDSEERYSHLEDMLRDFRAVGNLPKHTKLKRAALGGLTLLTLGAGFYLARRDQAQTQEIVQTQEQLDVKRKIGALREYLGARQKTGFANFTELGEVEGWVKMFEDERTAFAAYLNTDLTYEAIQKAAGQTNYDSLKIHLEEKDFPLVIEVDDLGGQYIDRFMLDLRRDRSKKVEEKWDQAKQRYEQKQKMFEQVKKISPVLN